MIEKYLTYDELASLLDVGRSTIQRRVKDGTLPKPIKLGQLVRFKQSEVLAALSRLSSENEG